MPSTGIDRRSGRVLRDLAHVRQSVEVIFTTQIGARVRRRTFGSFVPALLMRSNLSEAELALFFFAVKVALDLWEPRLLYQGPVYPVPPNSPERFRVGKVEFRLRCLYRPHALQGDFTTDARLVDL